MTNQRTPLGDFMSILNRGARCAVPVMFATALAAWGDSETNQRKSFIKFLDDINSRAGVHYPVPTPTDEKAFGPYLQQYVIILDFNKDMKARMDEFVAQIMKLGYGPTSTSRTIEQIAAAPQDLLAAKGAVNKMGQDIEMELAKVNAERTALKQPDDLKVVYDKTFERLVTTPALAMKKSATAFDVAIDASMKLADYINSHRNKLSVTGIQIQAKDQRTLDEIRPLLKAQQDAGERFQAAQRNVR